MSIVIPKEHLKDTVEEYFHIHNIEVPIYGGVLVLILTNSKSQIAELLPNIRVFEDDTDELYAHACFGAFGNADAYVMVLNFNNEYEDITDGTICHETAHITNFIAETRGIQPSFVNDEAYAYLAGWISDYVYSVIHKLKFKVTKRKLSSSQKK